MMFHLIKKKSRQLRKLNFYCNGTAKIGAHRYNEADLDMSIPIAALGFGASRNMIFKRSNYESVSYELNHGSLIVMSSPTNKYYSRNTSPAQGKGVPHQCHLQKFKMLRLIEFSLR